MTENITGERPYLLTDGLGSVRQAVDENGKVVAKYDYDPYGNPIEGESKPYGFTGEWWESELGLLHLRARWYAPKDGIFLGKDPLENQHPYGYVGGNPINKTDHSGLCEENGDEACWAVYEAIIRLCPICAQMERTTLTGDRKLSQENAIYLEGILQRVRTGWWPCDINIVDTGAQPGNRRGSPSSCAALKIIFENASTIKNQAHKYGVPPELVAGLLAAEIDLDNTWIGITLDNQVRHAYQTVASRTKGPTTWVAQNFINLMTDTSNPFWGDRVAGYTNVHHNTYVTVEQYMTNCGQPLPYGTSKRDYLPFLLTDEGSVEFTARMARFLADTRTGNKSPHYTDLDLVDMAQMWGAWRAGINGVTCEGICGFNRLSDFQIEQTLGKQAALSYPFFEYFQNYFNHY